MRRDADLEPRVFPAVTARHDLPDGVNPRNDGGLFLRHTQIQKFADGPELRAEFRQQRRDALAGLRGNGNRVRIFFAQQRRDAAGKLVNLVEHHQHRFFRRADFHQHRVHGVNLLLRPADG